MSPSGNLCAWAENTWSAVGTVNGRGYNGQQIDAICDALMGHAKWFEVYLSQFFDDLDLLVMLTICLDA